jgi:RNA polymerase sigma-70 factor, ECF subfamily
VTSPNEHRSVPDADTERFTALYDEHFARVWAYVVGRLGRQAAEEVVSDTFAVAWRRHARSRAAVLRALATLSDGEREVLTLVAWHGLPAPDAAVVLG